MKIKSNTTNKDLPWRFGLSETGLYLCHITTVARTGRRISSIFFWRRPLIETETSRKIFVGCVRFNFHNKYLCVIFKTCRDLVRALPQIPAPGPAGGSSPLPPLISPSLEKSCGRPWLLWVCVYTRCGTLHIERWLMITFDLLRYCSLIASARRER